MAGQLEAALTQTVGGEAGQVAGVVQPSEGAVGVDPVAGTYPRRDEDGAASMSEAARQAADSYSEAFRSSQDALGKLVHDVAGFFGSAKLWLDEQLRRTRD